ncbi:aminoacyl-tRNA hydrolase [uncultured Pseudodesulfovibrio sp.]|uniref:aminoacyl-tRNA hydrolase n=1 Tax=uncultured Pseudodesulfovibrio sp. TaxID=2035858 RepID=UPI0029C6672A|nr:aminoacyl-tRNA hydrolase [uncultured Pseudodesulfovibrio sp.]
MDFKGAIVGLGNPGSEYETTRHNIGFMLVDHLLHLANGRKSMRLEKIEESGDYDLWQCKFAGAYRLLVKPLTYMNLSGKAVSRVCGRHGIDPADLVVVHDELDLPVGRMKFKRGGGDNGHNGLKSIQERLGTPDYNRLRLGIGRPEDQYMPVTDWVLGSFDSAAQAVLPGIIEHAVKGLDIFFRRGMGFAQQHVNAFSLREEESE